jgi:hypothetical protein
MFEEKLKSKKNEVYKRQQTIDGKECYIVAKEFSEEKCFYMEYILHDILSKSDIKIARLLEFEAPAEGKRGKLIYEWLDGEVALDVIDDGVLAAEVIDQIIEWMKRFYEITGRQSGESWILGDVHMRNFIYNEEKNALYGFDFEEAEKGEIEKDVAKLFLYIATYEPEYSEARLTLAEYFLSGALMEFDIERQRLLDEINSEAGRMGERRNCEINAELLIRIAERLDF